MNSITIKKLKSLGPKGSVLYFILESFDVLWKKEFQRELRKKYLIWLWFENFVRQENWQKMKSAFAVLIYLFLTPEGKRLYRNKRKYMLGWLRMPLTIFKCYKCFRIFHEKKKYFNDASCSGQPIKANNNEILAPTEVISIE